MRTVMFNFHADVPPQQQETLMAQIGTWDGVHKTACLKPDATRPELRRMCYAYVEDSAEIKTIVERLSTLPEIESAFPPAERRLL
jgi:hypothetical protein